jgi:hypothetical protein
MTYAFDVQELCMREPRKATLVVIEAGAPWPVWLDPCCSGDLAVVTQSLEPQNNALVPQVASRLTQLEAMGWVLERIVLVTNAECEADAVSARTILARGLVGRLKNSRARELVLASDQPSGSAVHDGLALLARALEDGEVGISVRAGSDRAPASPKAVAPVQAAP